MSDLPDKKQKCIRDSYIYKCAQYLWRRFARGPHARWRRRQHLPLWKSDTERKVVLIDAGAHEGQLFTECLDSQLNVMVNTIAGASLGAPYFLVDSLQGSEIHLFEPNAVHIPALEHYRQNVEATVFVHNACAWIEDGYQSFYLSEGEWGDMGSTLYADKDFPDERESLDLESVQQVKSVDLGAFIRETTSQMNYVILKLDVEGAEFDILPALIDGGELEYVDELHIEWHDNCFDGAIPKRKELEREIRRRNLYYVEWY